MFHFAFCWFCHVGFLALQKAKRANRVQKVCSRFLAEFVLLWLITDIVRYPFFLYPQSQ